MKDICTADTPGQTMCEPNPLVLRVKIGFGIQGSGFRAQSGELRALGSDIDVRFSADL